MRGFGATRALRVALGKGQPRNDGVLTWLSDVLKTGGAAEITLSSATVPVNGPLTVCVLPEGRTTRIWAPAGIVRASRSASRLPTVVHKMKRRLASLLGLAGTLLAIAGLLPAHADLHVIESTVPTIKDARSQRAPTLFLSIWPSNWHLRLAEFATAQSRSHRVDACRYLGSCNQ
jgi:hypothetical protein